MACCICSGVSVGPEKGAVVRLYSGTTGRPGYGAVVQWYGWEYGKAEGGVGMHLRVCGGAGVDWCGVSVMWCGSALVSVEWRSTGDGERSVHKTQKKNLKQGRCWGWYIKY